MKLEVNEYVAIVVNCNIQLCKVITPPEGKELFPNNCDYSWVLILSQNITKYVSNFSISRLKDITGQTEPPHPPSPKQCNHSWSFDSESSDGKKAKFYCDLCGEEHIAVNRSIIEQDKSEPVGRVEHRKDTTQYGLMYTHLPAGTELYTRPPKDSTEPASKDAEFIAAVREVIQISDRKHDAWDKVKKYLAGIDVKYCDYCNGSGEATYMAGAGPDAYEELATCHKCNGTGELKEKS